MDLNWFKRKLCNLFKKKNSFIINTSASKSKAALTSTWSQWPKLTSRWQHRSVYAHRPVRGPTNRPKTKTSINWECVRRLSVLQLHSQGSLFVCIQFCRHLILSEKGHVDWKLMFFTLQKYYPQKEHYGDTLQFCKHCSILFWKVRYIHWSWLLGL